MANIECTREDEVLMMVSTGRWPEGAPAELRKHADACDVCRELGLAAVAIEGEAAIAAPALPSSGQVWWRAQLRAKQDAAREVARPITAVQMIAFAAAVGVVGAVFGASAQWFQRALRGLWSAVAGVSSSFSPSLPHDLASVNPVYWVILLVVGVGLVAGAAVVRWAFKEE